MRYSVRTKGVDELVALLQAKSAFKWSAVADKSLTQIFNRAARHPGTPVKSGELARSRRKQSSGSGVTYRGEFGYVKDYAPHVEYGHRGRKGGFVSGQRFLQKNVERQGKIYLTDIRRALRED
ncbi:TPA: hypothetical protein ACGO3A_001986 [Streptococcus suis]